MVFVPMLFVYLNIMHILQFSGNTFQSQRVLTLIHNLTQSHTAEIEIIKGDIDAERQEREISFDNMIRKYENLMTNMNHTVWRTDQITQRIDVTEESVSSE